MRQVNENKSFANGNGYSHANGNGYSDAGSPDISGWELAQVQPAHWWLMI